MVCRYGFCSGRGRGCIVVVVAVVESEVVDVVVVVVVGFGCGRACGGRVARVVMFVVVVVAVAVAVGLPFVVCCWFACCLVVGLWLSSSAASAFLSNAHVEVQHRAERHGRGRLR